MHEIRQRIVEYLKEKRQATVDELAAAIDLTPMAVRYHLNVLQADNLISAFAVRRHQGPGRPQQIYRLTEAADDLFPEDYRHLADYLLTEVGRRLGADGLSEIFADIADRLAAEAPPPRAGQTLEERLDQVAGFLADKGFSVTWEKEGDHYVIHTHSCPYRHIAREHRQICLLDQHIIGKMLNTLPVRIACLTTGDDHCTYKIDHPIELIIPAA